jgi:hypothetical protein
MGWTFSEDFTPASIVRELETVIAGATVLGSATTKPRPAERIHWQAIRAPQGNVVICCALIRQEDGEWGYKLMDESMGPNYYDCPMQLLNMATEPTPGTYAAEWRAKVRAHHAAH